MDDERRRRVLAIDRVDPKDFDVTEEEGKLGHVLPYSDSTFLSSPHLSLYPQRSLVNEAEKFLLTKL